MSDQYVLVTRQPGAIGSPDTVAYGPADDAAKLSEAGHLLTDGASPPATFEVLPLTEAKWGSL